MKNKKPTKDIVLISFIFEHNHKKMLEHYLTLYPQFYQELTALAKDLNSARLKQKKNAKSKKT